MEGFLVMSQKRLFRKVIMALYQRGRNPSTET
jgi:hypothetical protein